MAESMPVKRARGRNWSDRDSLLLIDIMGTDKTDGMTNHHFLKSKFGNGVNSKAKKSLWQNIAHTFAASADIPRGPVGLGKKWSNMISKHRQLYCDFVSKQRQTGGGPPPIPLDTITDHIMSVVGRSTVSVMGLAQGIDTSVVTQSQQSVEISQVPEWNVDLETGVCSNQMDVMPVGTTCTITTTTPSVVSHDGKVSEHNTPKNSNCTCGYLHCDEELLALRKEKIKLQIEVLKRQLQQ